MSLRVVFDTTTVVSALLFTHGRLTWLRRHWRDKEYVPLVSRETAAELTRVLRYPKFRLGGEEARELLSEYLPYCEVVDPADRCSIVCRDKNDQPFLDLAQTGEADVLVSGDRDLLALGGRTSFLKPKRRKPIAAECFLLDSNGVVPGGRSEVMPISGFILLLGKAPLAAGV